MRAFDNIKRTTLWLVATAVVLSSSTTSHPLSQVTQPKILILTEH
jgi:hypothetical protein